jgi:acyl-CoA hydrolase
MGDRGQGKPVCESAIEDYFHEIFPQDLNATETVFGGRIMELADVVAACACRRHSGQLHVATLSVDGFRFHQPGYKGETLVFKASVNRVWRSSMEIGVKVVAIDVQRASERHIVSAYFTFVALDASRRPMPLPPVLPETDEEKRRYEAADLRRKHRLAAPGA